jgi:hypothetical protein
VPSDRRSAAGFGDAVVRAGQRHRPVLEHVADQQVDQQLTLIRLQLERSYLPLGLGPDMPDLPGGAVCLHHRQDPAGRAVDPGGIRLRRGDRVPVQCGADHVLYRLRAAQKLARLRQPGPPLFAEAAGFVFGVAGLQGGLLGQLQRLDRGGRAAVDTLEVGGQLAAAGLDGCPAGRPTSIQTWVDAGDFSDRPQPRVRVGAFGEPDAEAGPEVVLQGGVVGFRRRHGGLEQDASVDG